jgi:hypothetical protein
MSAYVVEKNHIGYLVDAAYFLGVHYHYQGEWRRVINLERYALGQILWDENVKSVQYRYDETDRNNLPCACADAPDFIFDLPANTWPEEDYYLQVIQSCRCYDYQACEHSCYRESEAKAIIDAIQTDAVSKLLNQNDDLIWGCPDPCNNSQQFTRV